MDSLTFQPFLTGGSIGFPDTKRAPSFIQDELRLTLSGPVNTTIQGVINTSFKNSGLVVDEAYLSTNDLFKSIGFFSSDFMGAEVGKRRLAFGRLNQAYFNDLSSISRPLVYDLINAGSPLTTQGMFLNFGLGKLVDLKVGYSALSGRLASNDPVVNIPATGVRATDHTASVINARLTGGFDRFKLGMSTTVVNSSYSVLGEQKNDLTGFDVVLGPFNGVTLTAEKIQSLKTTQLENDGMDTLKLDGHYIGLDLALTKKFILGTRYGALKLSPPPFYSYLNEDHKVELVFNLTHLLTDTSSIRFEYKSVTTPTVEAKNYGPVGGAPNYYYFNGYITDFSYTVQYRFAIK